MHIKLPSQLIPTVDQLVKLNSNGNEYPLVRILDPFCTSTCQYVYDDGGEVTIPAGDAALKPA